MKKLLTCMVLGGFLLGFFCTGALAAGFALYEFGARGNALGGAMVGRADDPSAIAFNPAGIVQIDGSAIQLGASFILPKVDMDFTDGGRFSSEENIWIPPHFYYTKQLSDQSWFGLGVFSRFGLGTEFQPDWKGRYNSYYAAIKSVSVNPNYVRKIGENTSFALGIEAMWFEYESKKKLFPGVGDIDAKLKGDGTAYGWNVGIWQQASEKVRWGLAYKSEVEQKIKGEATFIKPDETPPGYFPDTGANAKITLPEMFFGGVCIQTGNKTTVELGVVRTNWSSYDKLEINYDDSLNPLDPSSNKTTSVKNYKDTWRYNVGVEWVTSPNWTWRVGYVYDESPIPDETIDYQLPANDRHIISLGFGYSEDDWNLDFSYSYLIIEDRHIYERSSDGVYEGDLHNGQTHIVGITYTRYF